MDRTRRKYGFTMTIQPAQKVPASYALSWKKKSEMKNEILSEFSKFAPNIKEYSKWLINPMIRHVAGEDTLMQL
jgi:hypothetical protein